MSQQYFGPPVVYKCEDSFIVEDETVSDITERLRELDKKGYQPLTGAIGEEAAVKIDHLRAEVASLKEEAKTARIEAECLAASCKAATDQLAAAQEQIDLLGVQGQEGWKLVPVEPTARMAGEGDALLPLRSDVPSSVKIYRAMIASSPMETKVSNATVEQYGWRMVPVEPTEAMIDKAEDLDWSDDDVRGNCYRQWHAMLAAAPALPQQVKSEDVMGERAKADRDAMLYGQGFMVGGKHVPLQDILIIPPAISAQEEKA